MNSWIYRLIHIDFQIQEIFPREGGTRLSDLQVSREIFPVSESQCGLINILHFIFISICFDVLKRSVLKHRYNYTKRYMEIGFYGHHFVLKRTRLPLTDP